MTRVWPVRRVFAACALAAVGVFANSAHPQTPATSESTTQKSDDSQSNGAKDAAGDRLRESLALLGFAPSFFEGFNDGESLTADEQAKLAQLLYRLPRISKSTLEAAAGQHEGLEPASIARAVHRGQVYYIRLLIHRVMREEVPAELRAQLGFDSYYRCVGSTLSRRIVILARDVPKAWKLDEPMNLHASALAIYIKQLPAEAVPATGERDEEPLLLFVAERVAWHAPTLLGHLGVDYGLFDSVRDKKPLTERELFYEMLFVASRMSPDYLDFQIRRLLEEKVELSERLSRNRDLPAQQRAAAERALERARGGASDIVPLFNEPEKHRGEFVVLRGEALRAIKIQVDDPQIRQRFELDHYFEVDLVTPDSQNNPVVCCLAELPPDMPLGESIHVSVRVAGFFLKSYAFKTRRSESALPGESSQQQLAPLVVGKTLTVIPTPTFGTPTQSLTLTAGLLIVMAGCGAFMWHVRRADRRAEQQLKLRRDELPAAISLDDPAKSPEANP